MKYLTLMNAGLGLLPGATRMCMLLSWQIMAVVAPAAGPPPVITLHPQDQTLPLGGTALFSVEATSGTALSYQWYFQTAPIAGATNNTYTRTNAQLTDAGTYYAAVQNGGGTVNSSNAMLTVFTITTNSTSSGMTPVAGETSLTWSHTINHGNNRALFVGICIQNGGSSTSVTYGGTPMTLVGRSKSTHTVEIWNLVAPAVGTANIVATFSGTLQAVGGAAAFNGVNQTTPNGNFVGAAGNSTTSSVVVPSVAGELVLDTLFANDGPTATPGGNQIAQWNLATGSGGGRVLGAGSTKAGAAAVTNTWTLSSSVEWQIGAVSIKSALRAGAAIWRSSGDTSPNTAKWSGSSFSASANTATVGQWRIIDGTEAPTRDEKIVVGVDTAGVISGEIYSGGIWSALPFAMASGRPSTEHGFDVAYESISGNALLVWNNGTTGTNNVTYRVWNGSTWSAAQTVAATLAGSAVHVKLAADPNSDTIIMQVCNEASDDYAIVWNGNNWTNGITLGTATSLESTDAAIAVEAQSGRALSVYDDTLAGTILEYRTWNGVVWSAAGSIAAPAGAVGDPAFVSLASDPTSSRVALAVLTSSSEAWFAVWDGNAWGSQLLATSTGATALSHDTAVAFESQSGRLLATYGKAGSTAVRYRIWTSGSGWSAEQTGPNLGGVPNAIALSADADSDLIMLAAQDANSDLHCVQWDGTAWGARNTLDLNTGETANQPFLFLYGDLISRASFADVVTTKSGLTNVFATTNLSYTITVTNRGPSTATNVVASDTLPAGIDVVGVSGGGTMVGGGAGQVVFDRASWNNVSGTLTWTHVTTNAANRLMLVGVSLGDYGATSNSAVTALSSGGSNLTKVRALTNGVISSELWQLVNPPTGTNTVTLTYVGTPTTIVAGAATFSGVDQAAPLSAVNSATGPRTLSSSVTISSATNEVVFDTIAVDKFFPPSAGAGQTQLWSIASNYEAGGASIKPGSSSVTMSWTLQNTAWADVVASVKAASPGGQVLFDRASWNNVSGTLTWTHVTTNAANRLMLVGVSLGNYGGTSNSAVTALSCGGANLTKVRALTNGIISSELWQLVNPPSGTNTVTLTYAGTPTTVVAGAATFSGVDPTTPLSAVNSGFGSRSINASVTLNSATNEIVFDNIAVDKFFPPTAAAGQTQLWSIGPYYEAGGASIKPGTNSVTMSWTLQNIGWAHVAASVKPAPLIGVVNWTIPTLAGGATTNFTVTVTAPLSGTLSNRVASTADTADSKPANNNGSATAAKVLTTVIPVADLVTTQSGPAIVAPLTNYTYTVTVSNAGPCAASNVVVTDTLAPTLTFVSASGGGTYLAGVVTWPALPSLANGGSTNFTVTVRAPLSGSLTNTAASTSPTADPDTPNNNGSAPAARVVTVVSPLQIDNTSFGASVQTLNWSHTVAPGSAGILIVGVSIDVTNATVNAATFNNRLPLTLIGQTTGPQTKVLMYRLLNPPVGTFAVSVNLNTTAGIVGGAVSLNGVNQTNPIAAFVGNSGTGSNASLTVASALGGMVIDTLAPKSPQYATNPSPAQTLEWNLSGANYSGAGSSAYGAANVSPSWSLDSAPSWAMGAVALNPATVLADLTLTATGPASVPATSNLTYTLTVTNLGAATGSNVVVSDVLPAGATFVSASSGGTHNAGVVTWPTLTNFGTGARTNYTVTIAAPASGTLTNIVYSTAFTADPDPSNNNGTGTGNQVLTTVTPLADVATTVTGPASVFATTDFSYTLTVTNAGPSPASEVVVSDALPAGATFVSASDGGTYDAGVVSWPPVASLASGATAYFTVTVTAPADGILLNTVASTSATTDLDSSNNDGSAPAAQVLTTVTPVADVATTVTGPAIAITNAPFRYTVAVANLGPSVATSVVVSNLLPAGATFVSASDGGTHHAGVVTWSLASLSSGSGTNFTVTAIAPVLGSLTNTVASAAVTADPDGSNNNGTTVAAWVVTGVYPWLVLTGQWLPQGGFQVEFHTHPDTIYSILASTNLMDWVTLVTTNSGSGFVQFVDQDAARYPQRFYRSAQGP